MDTAKLRKLEWTEIRGESSVSVCIHPLGPLDDVLSDAAEEIEKLRQELRDAVKSERERCATIADKIADIAYGDDWDGRFAAEQIAAAIREP